MTRRARATLAVAVVGLAALLGGCDDDGSEADRKGVGASCASNAECPETASQCLSFKGGYCGLAGCSDDEGCPEGSACVQHTDGQRYCFRVCVDKVDCNRNRPVESEANCSANVTFVGVGKNRKACVPPSAS